MKSYQDMLSRLCSTIVEHQLEYEDTIIIGDNSSGKSDVLRKIIQSDKGEKFYFIDAVNRYFDIDQIELKPIPKMHYSKEIIKQRLEENMFNHNDSFYYEGMPMAVEKLYISFASEIETLMNEFLNIQFTIRYGDIGWIVYINDEVVDLSSGYQALIRIFLEVLYFFKTKSCGTVIIDEIDEFLSVRNSGEILEFLRKRFPELKFIVTTHSADLVANADNINLILLHDNLFEVLDAGDFSTISQVYDIFNALFERKKKTEKEEIDEKLRILFNNKMSEIWGSEENKLFEQIKMQHLTKTQKLIVKQIEEWKI